jgi:predicted NBD/HSP70 family sugar kinase
VVLELGQRSETVRRANLSAIVRELHEHGPLSRSELVGRTGLTRSAIRGLIVELVAAGLVSEARAAARLGTPGRPSPVVRAEPTESVALALEIAVDSLAAALVGLGGEVLEVARVDRMGDHTSVDQIAADLSDLAMLVRSRRPEVDRIVGIGVAIVGLVRRVDGCVAMAPNLDWRDVPLGERLAEVFGSDVRITLANDADLGALAEVRRGVARGAANVLFISGEVGVGGGLVVDGKPMAGVAGYAGEVGHIPVNPTGISCRCGSVGCWETEIGAYALLRHAGYPADGGRMAIDAILRDAAAGGAAALTAIEEVGRWVGFGLAGLINVFNPRLIVLGGLLGRIHPYAAAIVDRELDRLTLPAPRRLVRVVPASLGSDAPLLGAAELALEPLLADPAAWVGPRGDLAYLASAS